MTNIKSITPIGKHQTYDLEVDHPDHQFYLANGVLTSNSHAVAYAIDSYWCAWLMKYYEEQWLSAYLESMSGNDDSRAKAFSEVRALGYKIVPIDIKHATKAWTVIEGKRLMPSLVSCKGVGTSAADELDGLRPFETLEELLWDEDGKWRCSKFNKKAFEGLIRVGAFRSLDCVGEGKLFENYQHMFKVVIENMNEIKKSTKKEPHKGRARFYELIREFADTPAYTKVEWIENNIKHFGSVDVNMLVEDDVQDRLLRKGVKSIDDYDGKNVYWFCMQKGIPKTTKNGRKYLMVHAVGPAGKAFKMFMWGWDGSNFEPYTAFVGEVSRSEFGFATSQKRVRILDV